MGLGAVATSTAIPVESALDGPISKKAGVQQAWHGANCTCRLCKLDKVKALAAKKAHYLTEENASLKQALAMAGTVL